MKKEIQKAPAFGINKEFDLAYQKYRANPNGKLKPKDEFYTHWLKVKHMEELLTPEYTQFENRPKEAMKHLMKVKKGQCTKAFYRSGIGYIDIVWGEVTDPVAHTGLGLAHIIDKHGAEIAQLGFKVEDFVAIIIQFADFKESDNGDEILFESKRFRIIVEKTYNGRSKHWILSAFDLRKKPQK